VSRSEDAVKRDGAVGASISGYGGGGGVAAVLPCWSVGRSLAAVAELLSGR